MAILDFIDTTFILTLGIVLLICGGIMIYCYRRLNALENGLISQGRVMQEFISNYNLTSQMTMRNSINTPSQMSVNNAITHDETDKIVVSDDESESESDNESDNESDHESDDIDVNLDVNIDDLDNTQLNFIDVGNSLNNNIEDFKFNDNIQHNFSESIEDISDGLDIKKLVLDDISNLEMDGLSENIDINVDNNTLEKKVIPISDSEGQDISKKNPGRLKVDELRELVVNRNLASNDEVNKLKKGELLKLLE